MFTGIVQALGTVQSVTPSEQGVELVIDAGPWPWRARPGDSVSVNGCCLTATADGALRFDVVSQTLRMTTLGALRAGDPVNLEHAATPETLLGGHIVQGHVDGVAEIDGVQTEEADWRLRVRPPRSLMPYIIEKGSVTLDGVSLTVAAADDEAFEVALIPTTREVTTLGRAAARSRCNIEVDYLAKIVVATVRRMGAGPEV